ncbi:hypothetical protein COCC4DRAFT_145495 [Bipolaris maydis ATCC 48331]|uniref:Uncharacterized protein n=2 Tax=Cochliobolus heterostrophus TaxID=5016 RepID=M2U229_COCH5|nr:uncharacterized protein COCC4DRAFT_145495 [Bipolaris maydis ATCC 48331]EMD88101.1 hypothetical protein COCHEDRAFT_1183424 [Bipolaris maydis C5]KAJ5024353.1 hypothetical protein J3E73DRAFT_425303 [Bipolaris maydis]ENI02315.1 hypothetical protein COCC4DRAFT_145495 [Bipolaris maydis ATCC 48331]KAJ5057758.1 hypothetical protein J3E74DRAFT_276822 [Bipolaris maydis]KAJ6195009.1 hypothetical protein J3E72DRAFT_248331 [Bipolaris maydis]
MSHTAEIWSALGLPARAAARLLLAPRYLINGFSRLREWNDNAWARTRYGPSYRYRLWLLFDARDLEVLEHIINQGTDKEVLELREAKLEQFRLVALVGALLATLALQAMSLPELSNTTFIVRSCFTQGTMLSLLATFFTCIQQRELGFVRTASALRIWLSNGVQYRDSREHLVWQSSLASLTLMEAPYELISLAVTNFVCGMSAYMWSAWKENLPLQKEGDVLRRLAVLVYFAVGTGFAFTLFPVLLGAKDEEGKLGSMEMDSLIEGQGHGQRMWDEGRVEAQQKRAR